MTRFQRFWQGSVAATALWLAGLSGCQQAPVRPQNPVLSLHGAEQGLKLTPRQMADVQVALGRTLEMRGDSEQAMAVYREAVRRDPSRADAYLRMAILCDQQGKFEESAGLYRKALAAQPGNAEVYCNMGYSLSLQSRWTEAEMNLRQSVALAPDQRRAHNNLGLVLAHSARWDEALAEFRRGGCDEAESHVNLAFVLTLERYWPEARVHYEQALALQPASTAAKQGMEQLQALVAKAGPTDDPLGLGARWRRVRGCAHDEPVVSAPKGGLAEPPPKVPDEAAPPPALAALVELSASVPEELAEAAPNTVVPVAYTVVAPLEAKPHVEATASGPVLDPVAESSSPARPEARPTQPASLALSQTVAPATARGDMPPTPTVAEQSPPPVVVSPLTHVERQVKELCGATGKDVEIRAESSTSLRIRFTVCSTEDGYKLASKILWMPELGPYQVALDIKVVE